MTTTTPTRPAWVAPVFGHDLDNEAPGTTHRLDHLYQLLNADDLNREALRQSLDDLARHLDHHLHHRRRQQQQWDFAGQAEDIACEISSAVYTAVVNELDKAKARTATS